LAQGWETWWPLQEKAFASVSDSLLSLAAIGPGDRVLDIGTGIGEPALAAARRVGPSGRVVALDRSAHMLAIARKRMAALGLDTVTLLEMDADALDFQEASFDVVLCRYSLMFLPDLASVLAKINALLRPNGAFAASVWDIASKVPMTSLALELAQTMFSLPPPAPGAPSIYSLAGGRLEQAFAVAGFHSIQTESLQCMLEVPSVSEYLRFLRNVNAPLAGILAKEPQKRRDAFWLELEAKIQPFVTPEGVVQLPGGTLCAVGRR